MATLSTPPQPPTSRSTAAATTTATHSHPCKFTTKTSFSSSSSFPAPSSSIYLSCSFHPRLIQRLTICHASLPPQTPPQSEPPPGGKNDPTRLKGSTAALATLQDRIQIFFAVLFWLSLFFWACAWDGKNKGSGRPNKGIRFRR